MAKTKGREVQIQGQHRRCVIEEEIEVLNVKPLCRPPSCQ